MDYAQESIRIRTESGGQIYTGLKAELQSTDDLATFYSPGIAGPCLEISKDVSLSKKMTIRKNTVAVISDGSAVLGLGNIGPEASLPVMEGKCMLFKHFGGVDAIPIVLNTKDTDEIVETIIRIAPTFGGINLEDIAAPRCFEIEERLAEKLDIPVFHDDQHGSAICALAGLINTLKINGKDKSSLRVVLAGAGAAGIATAKLMKSWGVANIEMIDSKGIVACDRTGGLTPEKELFCSSRSGTLAEALVGADVFFGVSKGNTVTPEMVKSMNDGAAIFAMANPTPEIMPDVALEAGATVVATGRSDFPNQINNCLVFPGFFRGMLDAGAIKVTNQMKLAAAQGLADLVKNPVPEKVIPNPFEAGVMEAVANAVKASV